VTRSLDTPDARAVGPSRPRSDPVSVAERTVLIHYHLFKNAGTSLDEALKRAFPGGWTDYERQHRILGPELAELIAARPEVRAISSHNAWLPPPEMVGVRLIPIVFVRHPLDRVRSVYDFERSQQADTPSARVARTHDIGGYVDWRLTYLDGTDRTIRDFQTMRLAPAGHGTDDLERAIDATERLAFVGLVETYGRSLRALREAIAPWIAIGRLRELHSNATPGRNERLSARLARLRRDLGDELYERLAAANSCDLELWERLRRRYADR
jgi:hypothetical protein